MSFPTGQLRKGLVSGGNAPISGSLNTNVKDHIAGDFPLKYCCWFHFDMKPPSTINGSPLTKSLALLAKNTTAPLRS